MILKYIQNFLRSIKQVFARPTYILLAATVFFAIVIFANLIPNREFVGFVITSPTFAFASKIKIIFGLAGYFINNGTLPGQVLFLGNAILAGLNISLAVFYFRRKIVADRLAGLGAVGIMTSFLGIGCGACGSVLLSSLFGLGASTQVVGFLPLRGLEFSIFSMAVLAVSSLYISKKIQDPNVCRINK